MALTPFIFAPFGNSGTQSPQSQTELSFVRNFNINRPAVMVFFAHGYEATLDRDVVRRQAVLQQLERAGLNAVLVAPQLAYDQRSDSPGRFAEPGFARQYFDEAAQRLAQMHDQQRLGQARPSRQTLETFRNMPILMVSYSGGYGATNAILNYAMRDPGIQGLSPAAQANPSLNQRIMGVVSMDSMYGGGELMTRFASQPHRPFLVSNYIPTSGRNLTAATNLAVQVHFANTGALARGQVDHQRNVRIYQATSGHPVLVESGLTRALSYIPGYRVNGDPTVPLQPGVRTATATQASPNPFTRLFMRQPTAQG